MILKICTNKARYDKGQVFPFLIAIVAVVIIIAMITVNLGQIGLFKTDVSNAADAAALAGASTLSAYLLGVGLQSDLMCGQMIVEVAAMIIYITAGIILIVTGAVNEDTTGTTVKEGITHIITAIVIYIATWIRSLVTWLQMLEQGKMAWSNAKKTAMQYAFQNAGIDEPRPTFYQFLWGVYGISREKAEQLARDNPTQIAAYNEIYFRGEDPSLNDANDPNKTIRNKIKRYTQNGFSRFMEEKAGIPGYWAWGQIKQGSISPPVVTSGYGWKVDNAGNATNSYDNGGSYKDYDNYLEVTVTGNVMYPLKIYMGSKLIKEMSEATWDKIDAIEDEHPVLGIILSLLVSLVNIILSPVLLVVAISPAGLMMGDGTEKALIKQTDGNLITVQVKRHKKATDLGLWKFRYGTVQAQAQAHAYRENNEIDVKPLLKEGIWQQEIISSITKALGCVIVAAAVAIAAGIGIKAGRVACLAASAACLVLAPLCIAGCWAASIALLIAAGIVLVKAVNACIDAFAKPKSEDQFKWFYTGKHLFETELTKVR